MPGPKKPPPTGIFRAYDAVHKALREHFEKVKCRGYKDKQGLLARGKKAFVDLIDSKVPSDNKVKPFCDWVEDHLTELKDSVPLDLYLDFHYVALQTIFTELLQPLVESASNPSQLPTLPDSPNAALMRCGLLIAALIENVKDTNEIHSTAEELHTDSWLKLLLNLLDLFEGGRIAGTDAASSVSDLLQEIATDSTSSRGRKFLSEDNRVDALGGLLYGSTFSGLSVNLVRTVCAILPQTRLEGFLDAAFGNQPLSPETRDSLKALLGEVKAQTGKVSSAVCRKIVNALSTEGTSQRPKGFTLSKLIVNGEDKLDNDKCQRRLARGDIIVYFDSFAVLVKSYSEDGTEAESVFGLGRIQSFKRATRGVGGNSDFTFQTGGKTNVTLGMADAEADAFEAITSQLRRTRGAQPERSPPPPIQRETSPATTSLGFVDIDAQVEHREDANNISHSGGTMKENRSMPPASPNVTDQENSNGPPSSLGSTLKSQSRAAPKMANLAKRKSAGAVPQMQPSPKSAGESRSTPTNAGSSSTRVTARPTRVSAAMASERLADLALQELSSPATGGIPVPPEPSTPLALKGGEERPREPLVPPHDDLARPNPTATEDPRSHRSMASLASVDTPKALFKDVNLLAQSPPGVVRPQLQGTRIAMTTPTVPLRRRNVEPTLAQNAEHRSTNTSNVAPVQEPEAATLGQSSQAPNSKGKKSVKITEQVQRAPPTFYAPPLTAPAENNAQAQRSHDQVGGSACDPSASGGLNHTFTLPQAPPTSAGEGSQDIASRKILPGINLGLQQLNASGIGPPAASVQHAIILSSAPTFSTDAQPSTTRRYSEGSAERQSKRVRYSPPRVKEKHTIRSTLEALASVTGSMFFKRLDAPAKKVARTHRHLSTSIEATAQKWCSEASATTTKISTAGAAYQTTVEKLVNATRVAKESAEERHAKVLDRMGAAAAATSLPDSLF